MRGRGRAIGVVAALLTGLITLVAAPSATAADLSDAGERAFAKLAACVAGADHLLAAVVVDSSGSLRQTDPQDQRVGAIQTALDALESLGADSEGVLDVQANLATFGTRYEELVGWGTVTGSHLDALRAITSGELPSRDRDNYTDYRAALRGAQQSLAARAVEVGGTSCKVVLWFTDGRLDVDGTGSGPATDAARGELCTPQGIVDGLRSDGVAVIALALLTQGGSGSVTDQDRERLKAVAEGEGAGEACGTVPIPASATAGAYLRADDAGALRRLFAQAGALIAGGTQGASVVCPDATCVEGQLDIPADRGIGGFRVVLERQAGSPPFTLVSPDGASAELVGGTTLDGATVGVTDREGLMVLDVVFRGSGSPGGSWTLVTGAAGTTMVDLYYFWGVTLTIEAPDGLVVGEQGTVVVSARHRDGSVVRSDELGSIDVVVNVDGEARSARAADDGGWLVDVTVPASDVPPSVHLDATARGVTAPSGIRVGPISASADLTTSFPPSFPTVTPTRLEFPAILGEGESRATVTFTGSDRGDTRACFEAAVVRAPERAGAVGVAPASECVDIPVGSAIDVDVVVSPQDAADGLVDGILPVRLEGVDAGEPIVVELPFELSMSRPVDEATRWGLIVLFVFGAVALAWITAELSRRVADRYRLSTDARAASVPVVVTAAGPQRTDRTDGVLLDPAFDFEPFGIAADRRMASFDARGLHFGRSFGWFPLTPGRAWVADVGGAAVVGHDRDALVLRPDGSRAPAGFPGSVGVVLVVEGADAESGSVQGRLVVVVDSREGVAAALPDRLEEIGAEPWDRITEAALAAVAVRADRAAGAAGATRAAGTDRPAATSAASPSPGADEAAGATPPGAILLPDWDDEPAGPVVRSSPTGAPDWADDLTAPAPPGRSQGKSRRTWSRAKPAKRQPEPADPDGDPPSDEPPIPPTVNFWD